MKSKAKDRMPEMSVPWRGSHRGINTKMCGIIAATYLVSHFSEMAGENQKDSGKKLPRGISTQKCGNIGAIFDVTFFLGKWRERSREEKVPLSKQVQAAANCQPIQRIINKRCKEARDNRPIDGMAKNFFESQQIIQFHWPHRHVYSLPNSSQIESIHQP